VRPGTEIALHLPSAPLHARIDPDKLAIAIGHLLMNATDALPDRRGSVGVTLESDRPLPAGLADQHDGHRFAALSVVDTGIGMTPEILARARDPFFTTRDVGLGAGLGLSMVDGLVKASGGHLEIESEPGQGTRVTMWLRLSIGDDAPKREPSPVPRA
jgi:signal transduction histidine kinase